MAIYVWVAVSLRGNKIGMSYLRAEAKKEWDQARRKTFWSKLSAHLRHRDVHLLDFEAISHQLELRSPRYTGKHEISLDEIVGSVGRYNDFIAMFLPLTPEMEQRWENIAAMYLNPVGSGVPPIELYKVGKSYFVKDGNHRVSVASQLKMATIEAYVWEYSLPVENVDGNVDIDTLLIQAEKRDFLHSTRLNELCPGHDIQLTMPGGYRELLHQIVRYQPILSEIDEEEVSFEDTVKGWYDLIYSPSEMIIEQSGILDHFPGCTTADLFIWTRREQEKLVKRYGHNIHLTQALRIVDTQTARFLTRWWKKIGSWMPG